MAATTTSSSGQVVSKLHQTAERLRVETTQLRERLRGERDAVRTLRAQHAAELRSERAAARRRHVELEAQLNAAKPTVSAAAVAASCEQCAKLRGLHDADIRRERSEHKKRESQLRAQLNEVRRGVSPSIVDGVTCQQCAKLNGELVKQKEVAKELDERLQKTVEADRLKASDLRTQHEKHITELSRITRANKLDAHKLLEELKTKDRIIGQLRRATGRTRTRGEDATGIEYNDGINMRKLREDIRKTEQPTLLPPATCDPKPEPILHHEKFHQNEVVERATIKQKNQMTCGGPGDDLEHPMEEDTDSAVSSAPSSMSPQPCSPLNEECSPLRCAVRSRTAGDVVRDHLSQPPTSLSPQPSEGYTTPPPGLWPDDPDHDILHFDEDDDRAENELTIAKRQVRELERALLVTRAAKSSSRHVTALSERVRQLEEREGELLRELGDLREQNELLEFRVLELAECHERPSFDSHQWTDRRDACTDTDGDVDFTKQLNDEPIRQRLVGMTNKTTDSEDKSCLMQVLLLLYGLDELSRRRAEPFNIDAHLQINDERESTPTNILMGGSAKGAGRDKQPDRLVAKVPPFTGRGVSADSDDDRATPVRAHEPSAPVPAVSTRGTQTERTATRAADDDDSERTRSLNLTAEVRKLDKLRESIEVVGNRNGRLVVSSGNNCNGCCEQKHARQLEFYRERVDVLERKVCVYESSGETQARQLAERLCREVRLEAQVKQLTASVQKLQTDNSRLEEERCELEEAENDTRLHCQRLEAEVVQLERSKMSSKRKARDARSQAEYWESMVNKYEERNYELEERECELRHRLEVMERTAPAILLFNMWKMMQDDPKLDVTGATLDRLKRCGTHGRDRSRERSRSPDDYRDKSRSPPRKGIKCAAVNDKIRTLEEERDRLVDQKEVMESKVRQLESQMNELKNSSSRKVTSEMGGDGSVTSLRSDDIELIKCLQEVKERENDMRKRISELEHRESAYMETLQQADDIWAEMETSYKRRISDAEQSEAELRDRLHRIEKRKPVDVGELEESERELVERTKLLERENTRLQAENKRLERELHAYREETGRHVDAGVASLTADVDKERRRAQELEKRVREGKAALQDAGNVHQVEVAAIKDQLSRTTNELFHLEVTNGELREEVDTLECKITELEQAMSERATADEQVIRDLSQELNERDRDLAAMQQRDMAAAAGERLGAALQGVKQCEVCSANVTTDLIGTVEGVRALCQLVSCPSTRPPDDAQARQRRFGRWL